MLAGAEIIDLNFRRHTDELRASWQARLLARAFTLGAHGGVVPRDLPSACILSIVCHNYEGALETLLATVFPGCRGVGLPALITAGKIAKTGHVMADVLTRGGVRFKNQALFRNTRNMERTFRKIADDAHLDDKDRVEFFAAIKRWVVCDYRLDPTMDPNDPDARRLTVH